MFRNPEYAVCYWNPNVVVMSMCGFRTHVYTVMHFFEQKSDEAKMEEMDKKLVNA